MRNGHCITSYIYFYGKGITSIKRSKDALAAARSLSLNSESKVLHKTSWVRENVWQVKQACMGKCRTAAMWA
jgi:hypothetical protein